MTFKYIINWIYIAFIMFWVFFYPLFYVFLVNRNKKSSRKKMLNIFSIIISIILSILVTGFSTYRTYRYYSLDNNTVSIYSFLNRAVKDYKDDEIIEFYSSDVVIERHAARPSARRKHNASKRKITYLKIDGGKYRIPIDDDKIIFFNINDSEEYVIRMHKNTMLIEWVSMRTKQ